MKTKKNYKWVATISTGLEYEVNNLSLSSTLKNHCRNFIRLVEKNSKQNGWAELPHKYLQKVFNSGYYKFLKPMVEAGIISVHDSYSNKLGFSKAYKVNTRVIETEEKVKEDFISYEEVKKLFKLVDIKESRKRDRKDYDKYFSEQISKLYLNEDELQQEIENRFIEITEKTFNIDEEVTYEIIKYPTKKPNGDDFFIKKEDAIKRAHKEGKRLLQDCDGKIYVESIINAVNNKRIRVFRSYTESVKNFIGGNFFANRNETNDRLDTNITNMASILLDVIKEDNDLVEIDMSNSQFAIFAHTLPDLKTEDSEYFKKISTNGTLYTNLQEKLSLKSREEAKTVCFEVLFSDWRNRSKYVTKMREMFPSVMEYVDTFKKENGSNQFSISLQKKEAEIFIDNLYPKVRKRKLFCLTKHDSLIVRREDEAEVRQIIKEYFNEIGFKAHLKN